MLKTLPLIPVTIYLLIGLFIVTLSEKESQTPQWKRLLNNVVRTFLWPLFSYGWVRNIPIRLAAITTTVFAFAFFLFGL